MPNVLTVGQLRAALVGLDDNLPIVLSKDAEGNDFSPLVEIDNDHRYEPESAWAGSTSLKTEVAVAQGLDPEEYGAVDAASDRIDVVIFWPLN